MHNQETGSLELECVTGLSYNAFVKSIVGFKRGVHSIHLHRGFNVNKANNMPDAIVYTRFVLQCEADSTGYEALQLPQMGVSV